MSLFKDTSFMVTVDLWFYISLLLQNYVFSIEIKNISMQKKN